MCCSSARCGPSRGELVHLHLVPGTRSGCRSLSLRGAGPGAGPGAGSGPEPLLPAALQGEKKKAPLGAATGAHVAVVFAR